MLDLNLVAALAQERREAVAREIGEARRGARLRRERLRTCVVEVRRAWKATLGLTLAYLRERSPLAG